MEYSPVEIRRRKRQAAAYLVVHFKEKLTPEGEQVYFALSLDGFHWEQVHGGKPVLESQQGDKGVRDHTIVRTKNGTFYILATDLGLAHEFHTKYKIMFRSYPSRWRVDNLFARMNRSVFLMVSNMELCFP